MVPMSYASGPSDSPLIGETIGEFLRNTVAKYPQQDALVSTQQNYRATYSEFYTQTEEVAKALLGIGLAKGDRIGVWSPNRYEWTLLQFATARVGIILVTLNPAYALNELEFAIEQSGIRAVFAPEHFRTSHYKKMLLQVQKKLKTLEHIVIFDENWDDFLSKSNHTNLIQLITAEELVQFDDPVNIQYTSGTTGKPKGVTLSHHNILN